MTRAAPAENEYLREPGYSERYRDTRFSTRSGPRTDARERRALARLLAHPAVERGLWLDMPSGAGRLSDLLPGEVVRVDRDAQMLRAAGERLPRACASGFALPFRAGSFAGEPRRRPTRHASVRASRTPGAAGTWGQPGRMLRGGRVFGRTSRSRAGAP